MVKEKIKIAIIGSGPSGLAATLPFLEHQDKFDLTIISSGKSLFTKEILSMQEHLRGLDRDEQHEFWEKKNKSSKTLIPKKLFFGSSDIYKNNENDLKISNDIEFDVSNSIGGLSNVWGANVSGFSKSDLTNYHNDNNYLRSELNLITKKFSISGFNDDIDKNSNQILNYNKEPLKYCYQAKEIISSYNRYRNYFKKINLRIGFSKLAVKSGIEKKIGNCDNSGLELYGCHQNSIFNSFFQFEKINKIFNLIEGTFVHEIKYREDGLSVAIRNKEGSSKLHFDKIIIAAGTIGTSKLALKLLKKHKVNSLVIKDSQKYFFLYFTLFKAKKNEEKNIIGLSQIFMQTEIDDHTFHFQLYHSLLQLRDTIRNFSNIKISNFIIKSFNFFFSRIMIGVVYFPEEISHRMKLNYEDNGTFSITKLKNDKFSFKYIFLLYIKLTKIFFKLKCLPLPIFIKSKVGVSQHFGSSLPESKSKDLGNVNLDGELIPFKNIYIADSSSLSRIPATPPTYISMSNAYRISSKIIKKYI